tara:strand:- start:1087 stop:1446 length:360 start_codon:yes stop_codon:yes gene_type:complete
MAPQSAGRQALDAFGYWMAGQTKRCANRAAGAALRTSPSALDPCFRRLCARMAKPKAVKAAAHKLARLIYSMLTMHRSRPDQIEITLLAARAERPQQARAGAGMTLVHNPLLVSSRPIN